jgi:hypothetical protein
MKIFTVGCLVLALIGGSVADAQEISAATRLRLVDGANDITLDRMTVRIVKGYVGTLTAHSYDTYTSYVVPQDRSGAWLQIPLEDPDNTALELRTIESADSTVQAIAMYRLQNRLYAVVATKSGNKLPDLYLKPAPVTFKIYLFNGNLDVARFKMERTIRSESVWTDAGDALDKVFFAK